MKNYLSFGGGVNSVAMMLILMDEGVIFGPEKDCESVYVNHGCDWPETLKYVEMFKENYPLTILTPQVGGFTNLYDYLYSKGKIAMRFPRWCTVDWKSIPLSKYYKKPAFVNIGYAFDESHRVKTYGADGFEYRYPLIEREVTRQGCVDIIKNHGLPVPIKSGCWFCPFQGVRDYRFLRYKHPELFCKVVALEEKHLKETWNRFMRCDGTTILHKPISKLINATAQGFLFEEMEYPPCQCGL